MEGTMLFPDQSSDSTKHTILHFDKIYNSSFLQRTQDTHVIHNITHRFRESGHTRHTQYNTYYIDSENQEMGT